MDNMEYRTLDRFPGYRFGEDGSVESCRSRWGTVPWRRLADRKLPKSPHLKVLLVDKDGCRGEHLVHRLVLEAFKGPCPAGLECCHDNDIGNDNRVSNLRWGTRSSNRHDCVRNGHDRSPKGERHGCAKLTEADVAQVFKRRSAGETQQAIADALGVNQSNVSHILNGRNWKHLRSPA